MLNHRIDVCSRSGCGSCFSVTVPLSKETLVQTRKTINSASAYNETLVGYRVLVLDDDGAVLEAMRGLLTRWGCEVITAQSAEEAEEKIHRNTKLPELLIVDYRLPDVVSGLDVVRILQDKLGRPVPALIITGDTGPERLREADASGYPLLHKPVQPAKLLTTIHYLLSQPV